MHTSNVGKNGRLRSRVFPHRITRRKSTVTLKRGAGYFKSEAYKVTMKKEGFADVSQQVDSQVSGWYIGNLMLGGLLGMLIIDPASGGMYTFPDAVKGTLAPNVGGAGGNAAVPAPVKVN